MTPDDDLLLDHPAEIASLLDELVAGGNAVQLRSGDESLSLTPLRHELGSGLLWLRLPGLQQTSPTWLLDGAVHAHALLDRVRIDFELGRRDVVLENGLPVLRMAVPTTLRRHQRRQSFRVAALSQHHPRALLPGSTALPAVDISAGGVALIWPAGQALPVPGELLGPLELELERELRLQLQLRVSHCRRREDGSAVLGCAFESLSAGNERLLMQQLQKMQRRARVVGR